MRADRNRDRAGDRGLLAPPPRRTAAAPQQHERDARAASAASAASVQRIWPSKAEQQQHQQQRATGGRGSTVRPRSPIDAAGKAPRSARRRAKKPSRPARARRLMMPARRARRGARNRRSRYRLAPRSRTQSAPFEHDDRGARCDAARRARASTHWRARRVASPPSGSRTVAIAAKHRGGPVSPVRQRCASMRRRLARERRVARHQRRAAERFVEVDRRPARQGRREVARAGPFEFGAEAFAIAMRDRERMRRRLLSPRRPEEAAARAARNTICADCRHTNRRRAPRDRARSGPAHARRRSARARPPHARAASVSAAGSSSALCEAM